MEAIRFLKMHGLGNDFVVIDARRRPVSLSSAQTRAIANRRTGVGCDQLIVVEPPRSNLADAFMRIRNADGGEVAACGNASRCVAAMILKENGGRQAILETAAGLLDAEVGDDGGITVDMGPAAFDWRDIPLAEPADTLHLEIAAGPLVDPVGVSVGNPHAVFFVDDVAAVPLEVFGPRIEHHPLFPERTNVEAAQVLSRDRIRLRVWERGAGITRACGTGACAAVAAAHRRKLTGRAVEVILDGGSLTVEWLRDNHMLMSGPIAISFSGTLDPSLLAGTR
jgi:diaminopimelate epimerase